MLVPYEYRRDNYRHPSWWRSKDDTCLPHFHSSVELLYVYKGELNACLNGKNYEVKANHILLSPSYTVHYYTTE